MDVGRRPESSRSQHYLYRTAIIGPNPHCLRTIDPGMRLRLWTADRRPAATSLMRVQCQEETLVERGCHQLLRDIVRHGRITRLILSHFPRSTDS